MGLSLITALIEASAGGPAENGKFIGWITLGPDQHYRPLINTDARYDSADEAKKAMEKLIEEIK